MTCASSKEDLRAPSIEVGPVLLSLSPLASPPSFNLTRRRRILFSFAAEIEVVMHRSTLKCFFRIGLKKLFIPEGWQIPRSRVRMTDKHCIEN